MGRIFRDYISGWNIVRVKKLYNEKSVSATGMLMLPMWFCISVIWGDVSVNVMDIVMILGFFIPIQFVWFSVLLHPVKRGKMFYLLPICIFTNMAQLVVISDEELHMELQLVLYGIFFLVELPLFIYVGKYTLHRLNEASEYKEAWHGSEN